MAYPDLFDQIVTKFDQRKIRKISAIETSMTACLRDRKWHRKCFLRNTPSFIFHQNQFDLHTTVNNGDIPI